MTVKKYWYAVVKDLQSPQWIPLSGPFDTREEADKVCNPAHTAFCESPGQGFSWFADYGVAAFRNPIKALFGTATSDFTIAESRQRE